jgi:hypothetical protein
MAYGQMTYCVRCGDPGYGDHCDKCEAEYRRELAQAYEDGQPHGVVVGRAFGGEIAIWVHEKAEHCGCRGGGWHCTDLDSLHPCPHHTGPHPECY